ncbi:penicillin-binding protein 2 [Micromonospora craterilacus]|uniref:Penicillin-binding protein 2 n=1 Tax=Micromonospora craterilacus TaxID=1655439 RepID=A0A2W2EWC1_9ACTN|nr:penicillin-binding protein 2 [Micromonospora craterilacus]PZG16758.1 penicillin-binding protein 2 [Micromonospora craterilacus]
MPSRSEEPRRDATGSRRGSSRGAGERDVPPRAAGERGGEGIGGISDARAYTPRGRTIREGAAPAAAGRVEQRRTPRSSRSQDPFRPALQVLDGGRSAGNRTGNRQGGQPRRDGGAGRATVVRTVTDRAPRDERAASTPRRRAGGREPRRGERPPGRRPSRKPPRPPRLADPGRRLRLATALVLALFVAIGIRLVALQAVETPAYADGGLADRLRTVPLPAPRGAIYDRDGATLAQSVEARYVYADPTKVEDVPATARALSPLLGIAASELAEKLRPRKRINGIDSQFEYVARGVDVDRAREIMALELPGIYTDRDERREVPGGDLAANLIGFPSVDMVGLEGLEARYDDLLHGEDGKRQFEVGLGKLAAPIPGGHSQTTPAKPGSSLVLTLDRDLQYRTQQILSRQAATVQASTAAAVVLDARTGEVLAQASHPTYNAAKPQASDPTDRMDAATSFVVDPGSVHKPITFGAALQEGVITPDTSFPVANGIRKGDTWFPDTHFANGRRMSVAGMMAYSSNVGTIQIADALGPERLIDYQQRFGLGKATGVGMPGEASGRLLPLPEWSESSRGSVPIGHSVDATPLQMAAAFAAIANDGTYVQPRLVKETIGPDGKRTPAEEPVTRQVLSPANAAALRTMMEAVTTVENATGVAAAIPGYRVAGKTGTGYRLVEGKKQPGDVGSFIGMAPAENPRYVIAVFVHSPGGGGGTVAAPAFREMMTFTLRHFKVPPSSEPAPKFTVFP